MNVGILSDSVSALYWAGFCLRRVWTEEWRWGPFIVSCNCFISLRVARGRPRDGFGLFSSLGFVLNFPSVFVFILRLSPPGTVLSRAHDHPTPAWAVPLNGPLWGKTTPGSCTCYGCSACIRPDLECGFTSPRSRADVDPGSKCYGVSPWCAGPPRPLPDHAPPPAGGRSCSIPAGPALFISSQAAMINEALNTSSLSPGPAEPHSWVNRPELLFHPAAMILDLRWADGEPPPHCCR